MKTIIKLRMSQIYPDAKYIKCNDKMKRNLEILLIRNHKLTDLHQQMVDLLAEKGVFIQEDFIRLSRK